ncbi:MAG: sulfatase-like hydrolase/transferase, partial [Candidatus Latescibacterota bacterium]|nr:sulfatase-like hydrolase/transferase [Candidatus Latescibacterota bacterium]
KTEDFEDTYIGRRAAEWIEHVPDDFPWHYFVSFVGPHDPFDPPSEYGDRYRDKAMPPAIADTLEGKPECIQKRAKDFSPEEITQTRRPYCAATELIDHQIGQILAALEKRGQLDNTYIVFASDHGELLGDHGLYAKSAAYEASLRVPLIVAGPDIEGGRVSDALCELIDLNATLCDFAGLAPQEGIDARSLRPVLNGSSDTHREDTVSALQNFRCIRTATHKYIHNHNDLDELYDLDRDHDELHNIAAAAADLVVDLSRRLRRRLI